MEGVVASRRLRKSYVASLENVGKSLSDPLKELGISDCNMREERKNISDNKVQIQSVNIKSRFMLKVICSVVILFLIVTGKIFFESEIKENAVLSKIYYEYKKDYSKLEFLEKFEDVSYKLDNTTGNIVPIKIKNYVVEKYIYNIKPYFLDMNLMQVANEILTEKKLKSEEKTNEDSVTTMSKIEGDLPVSTYLYDIKDIEENNSVETVDAQNKSESEIEAEVKNENDSQNNNKEVEELKEVSKNDTLENSFSENVDFSSMSALDIIKYKNIDMMVPVKGIITSRYGERDEIFAEIGTNHTGIDIANVLGTEIHSSTKGIVSKIGENNKYYGNYIEITTDEVVFKYAHLSKINVSEGQEINQNDVIGLMGSTGMSTGSHLHFEIKYDSNVVNPEELIAFD